MTRKKLWKRLSLPSKLLCIVFEVLSSSVAVLVIWIGLDPRNRSLFAWNPMNRYTYYGLMLLAVILLSLIPFKLIRASGKEQLPKHLPGRFTELLILLSLAVPVGFWLYLTPYQHTGETEPQLVLLDTVSGNNTPDVGVIFYTPEKNLHTLSFGENPAALKRLAKDPEAVRKHWFPLPELTPGETYYYQIDDQEPRAFSYFPGNELHIAIGSDTHIGTGHSNSSATQQILTNIAEAADPYDAFFDLGDRVEMGNDDAQWVSAIATFAPVTAHIPTGQVLGNHDGWFTGAELWKDHFAAPLHQGGSSSPYYKKIELAPDVHLFLLNLEWGTETYTKQQQRWFEAELEAIPESDWILVLSHAFYFASSTEYDGLPWYDNTKMIETFHELFVKEGVDAVFSGHDHQFEHLSVDAVDYFIVGAMGGKRDKTPTYISAGSRFRDFLEFGYADLLFSEDHNTLEVSFLNAEGSKIYSVTCVR